jgi:biopolymer transport protein ExbD
MNLNRLREALAAPMACLFVILILCVFAVQRRDSTGILVPMMRARAKPLSFCEFNGFTVYLRSDGRLAGGRRDEEVSRDVILSRIREAQHNVQDDTMFVIADPDVPYGDFAQLIADIHNAVPPDHVAVVTRVARVEGISYRGGVPEGPWADRCQFEWPATPGQPKWPERDVTPLPGGRISVWEAIRGKSSQP